MLAKSKLNSIKTLISQALTERQDEKMKDNLRSENEEYQSNETSSKATYKIMRLSNTCKRH